jgi:hypothetical protein
MRRQVLPIEQLEQLSVELMNSTDSKVLADWLQRFASSYNSHKGLLMNSQLAYNGFYLIAPIDL